MCNVPCNLCGDYEDCLLRKRREELEQEMFDISQYQEYLQKGKNNPDIEELGLADCLPEDY